MLRNKKIILVSHCVLNQNAVIQNWERAEGGFNNLILPILQHNYGILQLPCPEFTYLGDNRPPMTKADYNTCAYRLHCKQLAQQVVNQVKEYLKNGYTIHGMIGIQESPTCDINGNRGIFQEELHALLIKHAIHINTIDIPVNYIEGELCEFIQKFKDWL